MAERLEVHEHWYVSGPNARLSPGSRVNHSHALGNDPHEHPETGPASYQIDRDEWYAATGLHGGGRKKFTPKPTGPQLEFIPRERLHIKVVFADRGYSAALKLAGVKEAEYENAAAEFRAAAAGQIPQMEACEPGNGGAAVARMALSFEPADITYVYEDMRECQ